MLMQAAAIAGATEVFLIAAAAIANQRFKNAERIPMHWGLNLQPNSWAPRLLGLCFMPELAGVVLVAVTLGIGPGPEGGLAVLLVSLGMVLADLLHLFLVDTWRRRS